MPRRRRLFPEAHEWALRQKKALEAGLIPGDGQGWTRRR